MLEERIKLLAKELTFLKDIFMAHAGSAHGITVDDMEIKGLLEEEEVSCSHMHMPKGAPPKGECLPCG